ncbi:MAG TPA: imidazole glycerol phosphate synthase subunit HisH [Acidimicrobiales bacterium]|nr:imidazole glycerol phosphate synthase subunit HisH [Acidimicrobiales bacterium]
MTGTPLIAVLDYGIGNLRSAQKALEHLGAEALLTDNEETINQADALVLPGVGSFGRCISALEETGLRELAKTAAQEAAEGGRPFLGICVGLQMLYERSAETPGLEGLGVIDGEVELVSDVEKLPQMQWNLLKTETHPMFEGNEQKSWAYFVHSYAAPISSNTVATCIYGEEVCAAIAENNLWATQFHPEKSGKVGLKILENFIALAGVNL